MVSQLRGNWVGRFAVVVTCSALLTASFCGAEKNRVSQRIKFDPKAEQVELFEGIGLGKLDVKMVMKDSKKGTLLFENKTDKPITIKLPEAVAGVHILKQGFGQGGGGFGGGNNNQGGAGGQGQGGGGGQAQSVGGGMGGGMMGGMGGGMMGGMGGMGMGGMGGGFFSVQPEKVVQVPYKSVCLNHGKAEPRQLMTYQVVAIEEYTDNKTLQELLKMYGTGRIDEDIAQAATWHVANDMSWEELANKKVKVPGSPATPLYNRAQLMAAMQLVATAQGRAKERDKEQPAPRSYSEKKI